MCFVFILEVLIMDHSIKKRVCFFLLSMGFLPFSTIAFAQGLTGLTYLREQDNGTQSAYIQYLLYLPERYYSQTDYAWPLVVYLHGYLDINNYSNLMDGSLPGILEERRDLPFIAVCPHMKTSESWNPDKIRNIIDHISSEYRINKIKIYLTGISWGGKGTWATACAYPDLFAAIAPVCGPGSWPESQETADKLGNLPVWVFHGQNDTYYPSANVIKMVDGLRSYGANIRFTLYPDLGHECWNQTYSNLELCSSPACLSTPCRARLPLFARN